MIMDNWNSPAVQTGGEIFGGTLAWRSLYSVGSLVPEMLIYSSAKRLFTFLEHTQYLMTWKALSFLFIKMGNSLEEWPFSRWLSSPRHGICASSSSMWCAWVVVKSVTRSSRGGPVAVPLRMGCGCFLHWGRSAFRADASPSWSRVSKGAGHGPRAMRHIVPCEESRLVFEQLLDLMHEVDNTLSLPKGQTSPPRTGPSNPLESIVSSFLWDFNSPRLLSGEKDC